MTVTGSLELVRRFRKDSDLPALFTYLNPVYAYGFDRFLGDAVKQARTAC
jgi:tryptophan synthase alpha subunit